jgi:hypothetical protein
MIVSSRTELLTGLAAILVLLVGTASVQAQELEARRYANAPVGMNFLAVAYGYSTGDIFVDLSLPVEDLDADLNLLALRYTRTLDVGGRSAKLKVLVPVMSGDWSGRDLASGILRMREPFEPPAILERAHRATGGKMHRRTRGIA